MIKNEIDTTLKLQYWSQTTGWTAVGWLLIISGIISIFYLVISTLILNLYSSGPLIILIPFILILIYFGYLMTGTKAVRITIDRTNDSLTRIKLFRSKVQEKKEFAFDDITSISTVKKKFIVKTEKGFPLTRYEYDIIALTKNSEEILLMNTEEKVGLLAMLWGTNLNPYEVGSKIAKFIGVKFIEKKPSK